MQNSIAWEGIYGLIEGLKENTTLKHLILGNGFILLFIRLMSVVAMPDPPKGEVGAKYLKKSVEDLQAFVAKVVIHEYLLTREETGLYFNARRMASVLCKKLHGNGKTKLNKNVENKSFSYESRRIHFYQLTSTT